MGASGDGLKAPFTAKLSESRIKSRRRTNYLLLSFSFKYEVELAG